MERAAIEKLQTLKEMRALLDHFSSCRDEFPDEDVHRRRGISKTLIEEYGPLLMLAEHLDAGGARLTPASFDGPDGILHFESGAEVAVQITCAGENARTALQRERLALGHLVFENQDVQREPASKSIRTTGPSLTTKTGNTNEAIKEVLAALKKKNRNFKEGTKFLLILSRRNELSLSEDWTTRMRTAISDFGEISYESVFVCTRNAIFRADQTKTVR